MNVVASPLLLLVLLTCIAFRSFIQQRSTEAWTLCPKSSGHEQRWCDALCSRPAAWLAHQPPVVASVDFGTHHRRLNSESSCAPKPTEFCNRVHPANLAPLWRRFVGLQDKVPKIFNLILRQPAVFQIMLFMAIGLSTLNHDRGTIWFIF